MGVFFAVAVTFSVLKPGEKLLRDWARDIDLLLARLIALAYLAIKAKPPELACAFKFFLRLPMMSECDIL